MIRALATIEKIILAEGLPHHHDSTANGSAIPPAFSPTVYWNGPVDKCIEYTKALGLKDISRDTGEFYAMPGRTTGMRDTWDSPTARP